MLLNTLEVLLEKDHRDKEHLCLRLSKKEIGHYLTQYAFSVKMYPFIFICLSANFDLHSALFEGFSDLNFIVVAFIPASSYFHYYPKVLFYSYCTKWLNSFIMHYKCYLILYFFSTLSRSRFSNLNLITFNICLHRFIRESQFIQVWLSDIKLIEISYPAIKARTTLKIISKRRRHHRSQLKIYLLNDFKTRIENFEVFSEDGLKRLREKCNFPMI